MQVLHAHAHPLGASLLLLKQAWGDKDSVAAVKHLVQKLPAASIMTFARLVVVVGVVLWWSRTTRDAVTPALCECSLHGALLKLPPSPWRSTALSPPPTDYSVPL
jgi:hypothetical protein